MPEKAKINRLASIGADSQAANMPDCNGRILDYWFRSGQASLSGGVIAPMSFIELKGFADCLGLRLSPFDFKCLKAMSDKYCSYIVKGRELSCKAPYYRDDRTQEQKNKDIADRIRTMAKARRK